MLRIEGMDHIVLLVDDVERSVAWYRDLLGLEVLRFEDWKDGRVLFPSVRVSETTIIDILLRARGQNQRPEEEPGRRQNVDHICLVAAPLDLDELVASGRFDVIEGPVPRWGARGMGLSVYVRDPDGNTVELRHYAGTS